MAGRNSVGRAEPIMIFDGGARSEAACEGLTSMVLDEKIQREGKI